VRASAHLDFARDLPEDILRECTIRQDHLFVRGLKYVACNLNDKDVASVAAFKVDGIGDGDV
jgi:hypothetical protein